MAKKIKARVLIDCDLGRVNDVIEIDSDVDNIADLELSGKVDTSPAAVEYAESLQPQEKK